jgi:hypothetical protein
VIFSFPCCFPSNISPWQVQLIEKVKDQFVCIANCNRLCFPSFAAKISRGIPMNEIASK